MTTATPPAGRTGPDTRLPGAAGALVSALGDRARVCDLYDAEGAPVYHDLTGRDDYEIRELVALVRRHPGEVLDLAAGSGRLTLPLLALGRPVTALELSDRMLGLLADRLGTLPPAVRDRCRTVRADMRDFDLRRTFGVVVLGTTSVSLLDRAGRRALYAAVRRHLAPGGVFLMSTVDVRPDASDPAEIELAGAGASGRRYRVFEYLEPAGTHRRVTVVPEAPGAGPVVVCTTRIGLLSAERLADELVEAGFAAPTRHRLPAVGQRLRGTLIEAAPDSREPAPGSVGAPEPAWAGPEPGAGAAS